MSEFQHQSILYDPTTAEQDRLCLHPDMTPGQVTLHNAPPQWRAGFWTVNLGDVLFLVALIVWLIKR